MASLENVEDETVIKNKLICFAIQMSSQSHAFRMLEYFNNRTQLNTFPRSLFPVNLVTAIEVGGSSAQKGRALLAIKNVPCSPEKILSWISETPLIGRYIQRIYFIPPFCIASSSMILMDKASVACWAFETETGLAEFLLKQQPPKGGVRIQGSPESLSNRIGAALDSVIEYDWALSPTRFAHILSVIDLSDNMSSSSSSSDTHRFIVSIVPATYQLVYASCRKISVRNENGSPTKAIGKLNELISVIGMDNLNSVSSKCTAIDVGAAPGGWTRALISISDNIHVISIDPAVLDSNVVAQPGVTHIQKTVSDSVSDLIDMDVAADLVICDMNCPPHKTANLLLPIMTFIKSGGLIVITLKYKGAGRVHDGGFESVTQVFGSFIDTSYIQCLWLLANTNHERTLVLKRSHKRAFS